MFFRRKTSKVACDRDEGLLQSHVPYPECDLIRKQLPGRAQLTSEEPFHVLDAVADGISVGEGGFCRPDQAAVVFDISPQRLRVARSNTGKIRPCLERSAVAAVVCVEGRKKAVRIAL